MNHPDCPHLMGLVKDVPDGRLIAPIPAPIPGGTREGGGGGKTAHLTGRNWVNVPGYFFCTDHSTIRLPPNGVPAEESWSRLASTLATGPSERAYLCQHPRWRVEARSSERPKEVRKIPCPRSELPPSPEPEKPRTFSRLISLRLALPPLRRIVSPPARAGRAAVKRGVWEREGKACARPPPNPTPPP